MLMEVTANSTLAHLERVDVRSAWTTEAKDFTPWLAKNLNLLGEAIELSLELETEEKSVGAFKADILAKDTDSNSWVLIENQLERTDHSHLGQLLTYAAGLKAVTIVWIAASFADEHRAAIDWLNEITDASAKFFALELELWRIGESPCAPKFNVVSKPNVWVKRSATYTRAASLALDERYELARKLIEEHPDMSSRKLAKELGVSPATGHKYIKRLKIEHAQTG